MQTQSRLATVIHRELKNFFLFAIIIFVYGAIFAINFSESCRYYLPLLSIFFGILIILFSTDHDSARYYIYCSLAIFIAGIFLVIFYQEKNLKKTYFNHKIYVKGQGKITAVRQFYNPITKSFGNNLIIEIKNISKYEFSAKKNSIKKVSKKKITKKLKKKIKKTRLKKPTVKFKTKKLNGKKIYNKYINLANYLELDRPLIDRKKNNFFNDWIKINDESFFANPPQKLSLNINNIKQIYAINDEINFGAVIQPISSPDFITNFNMKNDAIAKQIDGFGFAIWQPQIYKKNQINNLDEKILQIRESINQKINKSLNGDVAGLIMALLIGEQNNISKELISSIRKTGLSHLLSISGYHLSLASAIFFLGFRFFLVRFEYLALRFDIKKISAISAIFASYFYYKIANSPLPSQRALIMVWLAMASLIFDKKFDSWRAIFLAILLLAIINPYNLLQVSFQLSFLGVIVVISYVNYWRKIIFPHTAMHLEEKFITTKLTNFMQYFYDIFFITLMVQIVSIPILMYNFQTFSIIAFISNLIAIPLVSFFIMPLAFLMLFLMIFNGENLLTDFLNFFTNIFIKLVNYFANYSFAVIETPILSNWCFVLSLLAVAIFFIVENKYIKIFCVISFFTIIIAGIDNKFPQLIIEKNQKFWAIYQEKKLYFSKKLTLTRQIKNYQRAFQNKDLQTIKSCSKNIKNNCQICKKNYCDLYFQNKKILILIKRQKIDKLCKKIYFNNYYAIINLTKKYQLPKCLFNYKNKIIIIDNKDFLNEKTNIIEFY